MFTIYIFCSSTESTACFHFYYSNNTMCDGKIVTSEKHVYYIGVNYHSCIQIFVRHIIFFLKDKHFLKGTLYLELKNSIFVPYNIFLSICFKITKIVIFHLNI